MSDLPPSGKSVVLLSSLLFDTDLLPEVCLLVVAPLQCRRHHQIQFFIIREIFARYGFWSVEVIQRFGCFDFLDPLQGACGILRPRANLCSEVQNPALKFRMVEEFSQMHLRRRITRNCRTTLSTSPDTRGMVSHRLKTIAVVQTFFLCFSRKAR